MKNSLYFIVSTFIIKNITINKNLQMERRYEHNTKGAQNAHFIAVYFIENRNTLA